jgi:hypothetical protein
MPPVSPTTLSGISELHYPTQWDKYVIIPLSGVMKLAEINKIYLIPWDK